MQLLDDSLWDLYSRGIIAAEEMLERAQRREELEQKLAQTPEGRDALKRIGGPVDAEELREAHRSGQE
jgi:Tfp pilus assembly ATPase PilU